jgi:hypothetical protein
MLQFTVTHRRRAYDQCAIRDSVSHARKLFGIREDRRCAYRRARFAISRLERIHHAQVAKSEIAHRPRSRANIESISRGNEYHAQTIEFS